MAKEKKDYIHWQDYEGLMKELDKAEKEKDSKKRKKLEKRISSLYRDGMIGHK